MEICVTYITIITCNYNPNVKFLFVFHWNNSVSTPLIKGLHLFRYREIVQTTELQDDLDPFFFRRQEIWIAVLWDYRLSL